MEKVKLIVYKQTKLFKICEQTIPYLPLIFKNKRQRVKCRQFFRYYHLRKAQNNMVKLLQKAKAKTLNWEPLKHDDSEFFWNIEPKSEA